MAAVFYFKMVRQTAQAGPLGWLRKGKYEEKICKFDFGRMYGGFAAVWLWECR
jgi:hypothetical protein